MTKSQQVLAVLADGPARTGEVAVELAWTIRRTSAMLHHLRRKGVVRRDTFPTANRRVRRLWIAL